MQLDITGRHVDVTPALREFAEDKLSKLLKLLDGPLEIHVVLGIEKHRHTAEIQVKSRTAVFSGAQETGDLYASIGEVVDKIERQALRHKEKRKAHKPRRGPRDPEIAAVIEANAAPQSVPADDDHEQRRAARVIRNPRYRLKPLALEDALLDLESSGEEVLVFRDAESDRLSVVYRRRDGDYGLVEPEY